MMRRASSNRGTGKGPLSQKAALRLVGLASFIWLVFVFYTHAVFHDVAVQLGRPKRDEHPAIEFLRSAKSLEKAVAAESRPEDDGQGDNVILPKSRKTTQKLTLQEQAEQACHLTVHKEDVPECIEEIHELHVMNPQVAQHYIQLLNTSGERNLEGVDSEHPCMKVDSATLRSACYQDVLATNDMTMARKMAQLIYQQDQPDHPAAVTLHDAKIACALAKEKGLCIHDVLGTGDIDMADGYDKHDAPKQDEHGIMQLESHHHKLTQEEAKQACRLVHPLDQEKCEALVLTMDDEETAKHYIHLLQDAEHNQEQEEEPDGVSLHDAKVACALAIEKGLCIHDVLGTGDLEVADGYDKHDAPEKDHKGQFQLESHHHQLTQQEAEQACRMVHPEDQEKCKQHVLTMDDEETAKHYIKLLQKQEEEEGEGEGKPETVSLHEAKIACALAVEKGLCIHDVVGTGDIEVAENYQKLAAPQRNEEGQLLLGSHHHRITQQQADQACRLVHLDDQEKCRELVLKMDDEETAKHYIMLLHEQEQKNAQRQSQQDESITEEDATLLCASVVNIDHQKQCLQDILGLPSRHIANHFVRLYDDQAALLVPQRDAEKLCNHLENRNSRPSCIKDLTQKNGIEAAGYYSAQLRNLVTGQGASTSIAEGENNKPRLTEAQAASVCKEMQQPERQEECKKDIQTLNNLGTAQKYVQLLLGSSSEK